MSNSCTPLAILTATSPVEAPLRSPAAGSTPLDALRILPLPTVNNTEETIDEAPSSEPPVSRRISALPPQLDTLSLPSASFSTSLTDLFAPLDTTSALEVPRPRPRTVSRLSFGLDSAFTARQRRSTLVGGAGFPSSSLKYSGAPMTKDARIRQGGKEEDVWICPFPQEGDGLEDVIDGKVVEGWTEEDWVEVSSVLLSKGYILDLSQRNEVFKTVPSTRASDQLQLDALILASDADESFELDILEHLSLPATRSASRKTGVLSVQSVVGIVPLSSTWTAVLIERWETWDGKSRENDLETTVRDLVAPVAFLHSQHIAHLSLSPTAFTSPHSSPASLALSASSFLQAKQLDPLAKPGAELISEPLVVPEEAEKYVAPEAKDGRSWDAIKADCWSVGTLLRELQTVKENDRTPFDSALTTVVASLTNIDPSERMSLRDCRRILDGSLGG